MVVETRTERFVYFRCLACKNLLALRKPDRAIEPPPSTQLEADRLRTPAGDARSSTVKKAQAPAREVELWILRKGDRELRCIACHLPSGIDLRLLEGEEFRRTELFQEAPQLEQCAQLWRSKLTARGWG